jgi:iron complex transport system ATP-binding protein
MTRIEARGLSVAFGPRRVVDGVDFALPAGALVGLIGPNGAGKTSLLRALAGLLPATGGQVLLEGVRLALVPRRQRAQRLAYLAQGHEVLWPLTVARLVELGRLPHLQPWSRPGGADREAVEGALAATEVADLADRPVTRLSGGERVRALLARALAGDPKVLLADEPVAGLDPYHALKVMELLGQRVLAGTTVLVVLHDLSLAARFCERLVLLDKGRIAADGDPAEVLRPDRLALSYRIRAQYGTAEGRPYLVPWSRLDPEARP